MRKTTCSGCGAENDRLPQRYCRVCHASNMRRTRPKHSELADAPRQRAVARSYANVYQRRGNLMPRPCEQCGQEAQKHHDDYTKPLQVRWLCVEHHRMFHEAQRHIADSAFLSIVSKHLMPRQPHSEV